MVSSTRPRRWRPSNGSRRPTTATASTRAMLPPGVESWGDISQQRGLPRRQDRLHAQRLQRLRAVEARQQSGLPEHRAAARAEGQQRRQPRRRQRRRLADIFKGAPNVDLAKKLALDLLDPANFTQMSAVGGGLFMPAYENLWTDELLAADPNFAIIKEQVSVAEPVPRPVVAGQPERRDRRDPRPGRARADRSAT